MSYTFVSAKLSNTNTPATMSLTIGAGQSVIIIATDQGATGSTLGISDGTNTYVLRGTTNETNGGTCNALIDCLAPVAGTYTLSISGGSAGGNQTQFLALLYTGIASYSAGSYVGHDYNGAIPTTTNGVATTAITPTSYNAILVAGVAGFTTGFAAGTGFNLRAVTETGYGIFAEEIEVTTGSQIGAFTYTGSSSGVAIVAGAYLESVVAGPQLQSWQNQGGMGSICAQ